MTAKPTLASVLLALGLALLPHDATAQAGASADAGFTLLFNGQNLDGWKVAKTAQPEALDGKTEVNAGRIKVLNGLLSYDPAIKGNCYIETARRFAKDMQIKLEFKPGPGCNNDFILRGAKFDIVPGKKETEKVKEGEWQTLEITVKGDQIEFKIDGAVVRTAKAAPAASTFMLRAEFGVIELRNIQFKE